MRVRLGVSAVVLACLLLGGPAQTASDDDDVRRAIRMDDLLKLESRPGSVVFSPDGVSIAFVRYHRVDALPAHEETNLVARLGGDIWLQDAPGRAPRNLTHGLNDASRWWAPQWSPDGRRLAFLSTRGDRVRVWVWERTTDRVQPLSSDSVVLEDAFHWVSADRVLCFGPPEGVVSRALSQAGETVEAATRAWAKAARGDVTASELDSLTFPLPPRRLFMVDVSTGTSRTVAADVAGEDGLPSPWWPSPAGNAVLALRAVPATLGLTAVTRIGVPRSVVLHRLDGQTAQLARPLPDSVLTDTVVWSPDGQELAFFAYGDRPINLAMLYGHAAAAVMPDYTETMSIGNPVRLWRVSLASGRVDQIDTGDIDLGYLGAPSFNWTVAGELLIHAPRRQYGATTMNNVPRRRFSTAPMPAGPPAPSEWWILGRDGHSRPLTATLRPMPETLHVTGNGAAALGVVEHDVWRIDLSTGDTKNLTAAFAPEVTGLLPPLASSGQATAVLLTARNQSYQPAKQYVLDLRSGTVGSLTSPAANATIAAFSPASQSVVYGAHDRGGTFLWREHPKLPRERLLETNTFLRSIVRGETRSFQFTSAHGQTLKAVLHLPPSYEEGKRYPLIADVYLGRRLGAGSGSALALPSERDVIAAADYAVLRFEAPLNPVGLDRELRDSMLMVGSSVLPAVDRAIGMGIVDPERLFVLGQSYGGWSVANLLVQTTRFKAAVAWAGAYDPLTVSNGSLPRSILLRYRDSPHQRAGPTGLRMSPSEMPWWHELDDIRQNTPISHAERIQTPLLMLHGDLDWVSIEAAEDLFNALVSMRKPARLVRYWGEGHVFEAPANNRDAYQRILSWFDEFGDIARDDKGNVIFDGDAVRSRKGAPALTPTDFARIGPVAHQVPGKGTSP